MAIEIRSKQQIIGEMIAKIIADTDLNDVAVNSVLLTLVEAAASSDFQTEGKLLQLLNIRNIEKTTGADLEQIAIEMGVLPSRIGSLPARSKVTIKDSAFNKVASNIYAGSSSPVSGDTVINIVDGSLFLHLAPYI